jgi:CheY-like chemotaxis protein/anti-sigma regulatory factor (Ser/Thr protein kinase)
MPLALVVEDEQSTGELLAEILRRRGFDSTLVQEGKGAAAWAKEHKPDLILLDLMLPDIDGYQVCEALKLDRSTNLIPVVMVTARDQPQDRVHGLEVGANGYVIKPFSMEQLNEAITQALAWQASIRRMGAEGQILFRLQSDTRYVEQVNNLLASLYLFTGLKEMQIHQLTMAVRELGVNAVEWGHRKQIDRIVTIAYHIHPDKVVIDIRDTGPGFDPKKLPHAARPEDPLAHMTVRESMGIREGGFGILMSRGLVDELQYNDKGNEVRLVKYLPKETESTAPAAS